MCANSLNFTLRTPGRITEEELKKYFIHRQDVNKWQPNIMRICYSVIKFFYLHVVERDRHIFKVLKAPSEKRLPAVLTREEINRIFAKNYDFSQLRFPFNHLFLRQPG